MLSKWMLDACLRKLHNLFSCTRICAMRWNELKGKGSLEQEEELSSCDVIKSQKFKFFSCQNEGICEG